MVELRERAGLAGETVGEGGVVAKRAREDFQCDEAVEGFLAGLVNHAHAAAPEELDNLKLRETRRQLFGGGWGERGRLGLGLARRAGG